MVRVQATAANTAYLAGEVVAFLDRSSPVESFCRATNALVLGSYAALPSPWAIAFLEAEGVPSKDAALSLQACPQVLCTPLSFLFGDLTIIQPTSTPLPLFLTEDVQEMSLGARLATT